MSLSTREKRFMVQKAHQAKDLDAENEWNHFCNFAKDLDTGERVAVDQLNRVASQQLPEREERSQRFSGERSHRLSSDAKDIFAHAMASEPILSDGPSVERSENIKLMMEKLEEGKITQNEFNTIMRVEMADKRMAKPAVAAHDDRMELLSAKLAAGQISQEEFEQMAKVEDAAATAVAQAAKVERRKKAKAQMAQMAKAAKAAKKKKPSAKEMAAKRPVFKQGAFCSSCANEFTLFNRRHHCRHCGHSFCHDCCGQSIAIADMGYQEPVRCCKNCYRLLIEIHLRNSKWELQGTKGTAKEKSLAKLYHRKGYEASLKQMESYLWGADMTVAMLDGDEAK
jgi:hypothetical protein